MGRQINFYASSEDFEMLLNFWLKMGLQFVTQDPKSKALLFDTLIKPTHLKVPFYVYDKELGEIVFNSKTGLIHDGKSPLLQVTPTTVNSEQLLIRRGRVWVSTMYWNESGEKCYANPSLIKYYSETVKFIKRLMPFKTIYLGENRDYNKKIYISDILFTEGQTGKYKLC